jgi:hypothetical protein
MTFHLNPSAVAIKLAVFLSQQFANCTSETVAAGPLLDAMNTFFIFETA